MIPMRGAKILTGVGCLLFALSFISLCISLALPIATNGRTSWDEAAMGYVPGAICSCMSLLLLVGGLVWLLMARRSRSPETPPT